VPVASQGPGDRNLGAGIKLILEELRDLRIEMREMRVEMRADRQRAEEDRRRADEERRQADEERRQFAAERRVFAEEQRQANARFEGLMRVFREDSARRDAATQTALKDIRTVGFAIVKTLNHHTRILERIDRKLGVRGNGRPGGGNGRSA
jgi:hypothetical protein